MLLIPSIKVPSLRSWASERPSFVETAASSTDAVEASRRWTAAGFRRLHVSMTGSTPHENAEDVVRDILRFIELPVQVDIGATEESTLRALFEAGTAWIVVGARALTDPLWLVEQASLAPGRLILAIDLPGRSAFGTSRGPRSQQHPLDVIAGAAALDLGGVLISTDDSAVRAPVDPLVTIEDVVSASPWPVLVAGAVHSLQSLRNLELRGVGAVILEPDTLVDAPDLRLVAEEFAA